MHSIFFGGMSQYSYVNNVLTQDNNVPFVKTISRVSRDAGGNLQENIFPVVMSSLVGASAEFIPDHQVPHYRSEIIKLSSLVADSTLVGHIYGGIYSPMTNPFASNQTSVTNAHNVIYEVWLTKSTVTGFTPLNGENPLKVSVFPNPAKSNLNASLYLPYASYVELLITDVSGRIVAERYFERLPEGRQVIDLSDRVRLAGGVYAFNFIFDGKYSAIEKITITE